MTREYESTLREFHHWLRDKEIKGKVDEETWALIYAKTLELERQEALVEEVARLVDSIDYIGARGSDRLCAHLEELKEEVAFHLAGDRVGVRHVLTEGCGSGDCGYFTHYLVHLPPGAPKLDHITYHAKAGALEDARVKLNELEHVPPDEVPEAEHTSGELETLITYLERELQF